MRALLTSTNTPFTISSFRAGEIIYAQGQACDSVLHLERGRVRLAVVARSGKEGICGIVEAGGFLGEDVLIGQSVRRQTATAMVATDVLVVATASITRLLHTQPAILDRLIGHILARHNHLEADLADQLLHSSEQRLARALILLAGCDTEHPCRCAVPHVSQELIAEMVGTSRSRVNFLISRLKKRGLLEQHGGVVEITPPLSRVVENELRASATGRPGSRRVAAAPSPQRPPGRVPTGGPED